jgi:uncharacterized protein (DUF58 family)
VSGFIHENDLEVESSMTSSMSNSLLTPEMMAKLERLELVSRKIFRGGLKGERRSKRKGESVEFADYRNYVSGDDLRFIDWNLYARLDRLYLKLFQEEEDLHFYCLIDASPSMAAGQPSKIESARRLAAALGFIGLCRADRVKIDTLAGLKNSQPLRGRSSLSRMLDLLHQIEPDERSNLLEGVKTFALRNRGKGVIVLITDLMDKSGYEAALRMLVANQMDIYLIHLLSPEELQPTLMGDLRLIDCEDQDEVEISISPAVLKRYKQTLENFLQQAKQFCSRRAINYLLMPSDRAVDLMVTQYLCERGLVR